MGVLIKPLTRAHTQAELSSLAPRCWVKNTPSFPLPSQFTSLVTLPSQTRRGARPSRASELVGRVCLPELRHRRREAAHVDVAATLSKGCQLSWALTCQFCHNALLLWRNSQVFFFFLLPSINFTFSLQKVNFLKKIYSWFTVLY